ncbi:MAG: RNA polymerase sigma-70 factor [Bacteroidales bacterium]|nr:RNA polymerase sigma-70 factor [Bacteroidales bacterium]
MTLPDSELAERLRKGDLEAFDLIYGLYAGKLHAFGLRYLRSSDEAEELVQSVFLKVWENHRKIDRELSFRSYLFTIAYNDICKVFRRRSYLQKYILETLHENTLTSSASEEGAEYQSVLEEVQRLIGNLPENQKQAFIRSKIDGKPSKEVAAELGISPGTVDNYISGTLKMIRRKLSSENLSMVLFISLFLL